MRLVSEMLLKSKTPIQKQIINTFKFLQSPLTLSEIVEYLVSGDEPRPVKSEVLSSEIKDLVRIGELSFFEGYYFVDHTAINKLVVSRTQYISQIRQSYTDIHKRVNLIKRIKEVYMMGIIGGFYGFRSSVDSKGDQKDINVLNLVLVIESGNLEKVNKIMSFINKALRISNKINIEDVFENDKLRFDNRSKDNALKLLSIEPLYNQNNIYESLLHTNSWIFDFFPNYPLSKVNFSYKIRDFKS